MKTLFLLRHAKSSWDDPDLDDFDRPLNDRGRKSAKAMAKYLIDEGLRPDAVLCSPALRTRQTCQRVLGKFAPLPPTDYNAALYLAEPEELLLRIRQTPDTVERLMVIGHNPGMHALALALAGGGAVAASRALKDKFPTAALAVLETDAACWADAAESEFHLARFVLPRGLMTA